MTTTSISDPLVGSVLDGRYEIQKRLARGGMATVYTALDTRLTRIVAVKVMHEGLGDDNDFSRKFDREARAAAKLSHPNVVSVFDQGLDFGRPYIVMELVEGRTLRNVITRDAPLDPLRCLELIDHVLSALVAAHDNGLVHRDVKPENVLISDRGQLKVADFGLARAITAQTATATQGLLIGTVSYLPPELVTVGRADTRSDVYSTGVVLFELLTGSKPHTGETPIQVAYAHVHNDVPPPSSRMKTHWQTSRDAIPPYVDALVAAATRRNPDGRPEDARELQGMVRRARKALSNGVMNDPQLTSDFNQVGHVDGTDGAPQVSPTSIPSPDEITPYAPAASGSSAVGATRASRVSPHALRSPASAAGQRRARSAATPVAVDSPADSASAMAVTAPPPARRRMADAQRTRNRPATRQPSRRTARLRLTLVAGVLIVLAALGIGGAAWWVSDGQYVAAPDLVTMTQPAAQESVAQTNLQLSFEEVFSETVPAGEVVSTDPAAGLDVKRDGTIHAMVSKGPERFDMPKVVGTSREDAIAALNSTNLAVGTVDEAWDEQAPVGQVVRASIEPGTKLRRGDKVDLTVSKGPQPIKVTDHTGQDADKANRELSSAGFRVEVTTANSKEVPAGKVIAQNPAGGELHRGDTVKLTRSLGPVMVTVPQVKAMRIDDATKEMEKVGFKVQTKPSPTDLGLGFVAYSEAGGGAKAAEGSTITLFTV